MKESLTMEETASFLKVKVRMLRSLCFQKRIPYFKVGNLVRFEKGAVVRWLEQNGNQPKSE